MSYIDAKMQAIVAEVLGLQGLNLMPQNLLGQTILLEYYWIAYLRSERENAIEQSCLAVIKTNEWCRGFYGLIDNEHGDFLEKKRIDLEEWTDLVVAHLHHLDVVASLDDTVLWGDSDICELILETSRTHTHFIIKQRPTASENLEELWQILKTIQATFAA